MVGRLEMISVAVVSQVGVAAVVAALLEITILVTRLVAVRLVTIIRTSGGNGTSTGCAG